MIEIKQAKEIINYFARHNISDAYNVFEFQNEKVSNEDLLGKLLNQYPTSDALIKDLCKQYRQMCTHVIPKKDKMPALLKQSGYIINAQNSANSFFYGRKQELLKMDICSNKKIKKNILLVGKPGTGKTTLVEEFAIRKQLHNIYVVECAKLIGSTEYRGSFEQRIVDLLKYAKEFGLIVFFDEIHTLINLGKSTGGMSITDILKPYLLDKEMMFIGATTFKEFQIFTEDEAFKRRFSIIKVKEPVDEELIEIKKSIEATVFFDKILTDEETLFVISELRKKLPMMFFPDKLIDFLDFMYSYKTVADSNITLIAVLNEFINDCE